MKIHIKNSIRSVVSLASALALLTVGILPALVGSPSAYAVGEVTSRQVSMSQSAPGATGVTYAISWKPASTTSLTDVIVQFCSDSPIPTSTTCIYPTGFSISSSSSISPTYGGDLNASACTSAVTASAAQVGTSGTAVYNTVELSYSTACAITSGTTESITLTGVTNPTTTCTTASACEFWARILTYSAATTYTTGDQTNIVDEGGVALSTATAISVSATVEEQINFCVYAASVSCGGTTSVTIGGGTTPPTLSTTTAYYNGDEDFSLVTNASKGVGISILGPANLTDAEGSTIPAQTTAQTLPTGTANGGWGIWLKSLCTGMTATSPYSTTTDNVVYTATSTSATQIASTAGPDSSCVTTIEYGAIAGSTTPSGVYTNSPGDQLIATGTF
jgi:hypothetical protein